MLYDVTRSFGASWLSRGTHLFQFHFYDSSLLKKVSNRLLRNSDKISLVSCTLSSGGTWFEFRYVLTECLTHSHKNSQILTCFKICHRRLLPQFQLVNKFPAFYGTKMFIIVFTADRHWSLSWASYTNPVYDLPLHLRSTLSVSLVTTTRHVLRLRIEKEAFRCGG
jgi:hypothetical protein